MTRSPRPSQDSTSQRPAPGAPAAPRPAPPRSPAEPGALLPDRSRIEQIRGMALQERAPALEALREELAAALHQDSTDHDRPHRRSGPDAHGTPRD